MQGLLKQPRQMQPESQQEVPQEVPQEAQQEMPAENPQAPAPQAPEEQAEQSDENDPALKTAINFVKRALYETGAADGIHETMKKSQNPAEDMALLAYELTAVADEKTGGQVPDELLISLAATVLAEISDIAEASGVQLQPADVASALKIMILRFAGEMGHDTRELQAAFDQVSPDQINQMAAQEE
jgi:hypothetical protein